MKLQGCRGTPARRGSRQDRQSFGRNEVDAKNRLGILPDLVGTFEDAIVDPVVVVLAIVGVIVPANLWPGVVDAAPVVWQQMLAGLVDHQVPLIFFNEDIDGPRAVHDVPAEVVKILSRFGCVDGQGNVLATFGGTEFAKIRVLGKVLSFRLSRSK